jgi:uncharacterized protein (TIGR00255 family)
VESMTGYGVASASLGNGRVEVELRAVNHRYLEVRLSAGPEVAGHAHFLEGELRRRCHRGRYDVAVRLTGATPLAARLDVGRARVLFAELTALRDELAPDAEVPIAALVTVPELFTAPREVDAGAIERALREAFDGAFDAMVQMRRMEGQNLAQELTGCLDRLDAHRAAFGERAAGAVERQRTRLRERLGRLLADQDHALDPTRLETEVALLADKSDVTEELARLESHFSQLRHMIESDEPTGRRIDFLLQEVNREVNTLGAKSHNAETAQRIVETKAEIEKMRQQVANVA